LRFCIRPVNRAFVLLAIMDIRAHPISFCARDLLVFSLLPRCGYYGRHVLARDTEKHRRAAATTVAKSLLGTLRSIAERVWRSTSVAMCVLSPERRSP
jgi:hypothetical protein